MSKWDAEKVRADCQKWKDEVESLVGKTNIYLLSLIHISSLRWLHIISDTAVAQITRSAGASATIC